MLMDPSAETATIESKTLEFMDHYNEAIKIFS